MKYLFQFNGTLEIESESIESAKDKATEMFDALDKQFAVSDVKVVDKQSGYFI